MAPDVSVTEPETPGSRGRPVWAQWSSERLAARAFGVYVVVAMPVIVFSLGRYHWFLGDDWDFLSDRTAGSLHDLLRPHAEHWSTLPVLAYRLEWHLFGLHYFGFQVVVVTLHLCTAVLLRSVMRRAGVNPWVATAAAGMFVLFGPGEQNILWSFQIGMVGSLLFGLVHLILAGRDGGRQRADWLGLAAGLASLMCSGIGPVMVGAVGLAVLLRRGWRMAAFHTVPLAVLFLAWFVAFRADQPKSPGHAGIGDYVDWLKEATLGVFKALGHYSIVGIALGALLILGLTLAWQPLARSGDWASLRRRSAEPLALLVGGVGFVLLTASSRFAFGAGVARSSRYIYADAVFVLPALAVAADAVARRWRYALPIVVAALLIPVPANIKAFDPGTGFFNGTYFKHKRLEIEGIAWSDLAPQVPPTERPTPDFLGGEGPSVGWLLAGRRSGAIPNPGPLAADVQTEILIRLGLAQSVSVSSEPTPARNCRTYSAPLDLDPHRGDRLFISTAIGVRLRNRPKPALFAVSFTPLSGQELEVTLDGMHLRLEAARPAKSFRICS
jgi:hypothetical protein